MLEKSITDDINPTERIGAIMPVSAGEEKLATSTQSFASYMENASVSQSAAGKPQMISPFDLASQTPKSGIVSPNLATIQSSMNLAQNTLGDLQSQLNNPNLKLKASQKHLVQNKLEDVNINLQSASGKLGVAPVESSSSGTGPLAKYLNYVSDGMNQLQAAQNQIAHLQEKGTNLGPADFLTIQLKLNKAQQEIDFTSMLLSKAVEGVKTLMNVQI